MSQASIESKIASILDMRDEMKRIEHNMALAKEGLLKEMEEENRTFIATPSGKAEIREYSVQRYDNIEVDILVERIRNGEQLSPEDTKKLAKSSDVKFVLVKEL